MLFNYIKRHRDWCFSTFGFGEKTIGLTGHIERELDEIRNSPYDLEEWIDVIILSIEGAIRCGITGENRYGHSPQIIIQALIDKQIKNFHRKWAPPTDEDVCIEHIREEEG